MSGVVKCLSRNLQLRNGQRSLLTSWLLLDSLAAQPVAMTSQQLPAFAQTCMY